MKKFKRKLKIHVNYESKIKSGFLLFILQRWWNDQKSRGPLLLNILSVSALFSISLEHLGEGSNPPTPPNSEIICGQNVGTKVVCGINFFFEKKAMLKI